MKISRNVFFFIGSYQRRHILLTNTPKPVKVTVKMSLLTIPFRLGIFRRSSVLVKASKGSHLFQRTFANKTCSKMNTKDLLMNIVSETCDTNIDKVTVVGTGDVGMACVFSILAQVFNTIHLT